MSDKGSQRIHGIDALRAIAMLLGIVLHAVIAYKVLPLPAWPHDQQFHAGVFDYLYLFIHSFRMPLFFLIAGYFCRFLLYRIGEKAFIRHRWKRIAIPFLISLVLILPLTIFPFLLYQSHTRYPDDWTRAFNESLHNLLRWNGMAHLWFLYYLLIFYVAVIVYQRLKTFLRLQARIALLSERWKKVNLSGPFWVLVAVVPLWLILLPVNGFFVEVDTGFIPEFHYLAFYGFFFVIGWMIHIRPEIFGLLSKRVWLLLSLGVLISAYLFYVEMRGLAGPADSRLHILLKGAAALQTIVLVLGSMGFFLKYFTSESMVWKYISDASYWMYLLHLGLVAGLQIYLAETTLPGWIRFPVVLVVTGAVTLITYQLFIRYTLIGEYLHGERKRKIENRR